MPVIRVDNLGKSYLIGHDRKAVGAFQYQSLRDTLAHQTRALWQRLRHPLSPNRENTVLEEFWALKDVNFDIQPGERVGIIGRNGAGKSTLLKLLSRITEPTTGRIELNGRVASLLEVGTGFHPELTGRENIYLNGSVLGMKRSEIKKKFAEIVAFAEVEKFLDTPVKRYSSGMYVRLAFAVAAHLEPEILLVDEVLAVGDTAFQKKCLGKMEDVAQNEGRTVLFVSHNMAAINGLCERSLLVDNGAIAADGNTDQVIQEYLRKTDSEGNGVNDFIFGDRHGIGKDIWFTRVGLSGRDARHPNSVISGETLAIKCGYESRIDLNNINVGISVFDSFGNRICAMNSVTQIKKSFKKGDGTIICHVKSLPLLVGDYWLTLGILNDSLTHVYDHANAVLHFKIQKSAANDTFPGKDLGIVSVDYEWETT